MISGIDEIPEILIHMSIRQITIELSEGPVIQPHVVDFNQCWRLICSKPLYRVFCMSESGGLILPRDGTVQVETSVFYT